MRSLLTSTVALLFAVFVAACGADPPAAAAGGERVVLLHGLGRSDLSMLFMERGLEERGYEVVNIGYPSREHSIEHLAHEELRPALEACCSDSTRVTHFVTHSLGGIVLRYYLAEHDVPNRGRVVMLSPPNRGSELAEWVADYELLESILGPSVEQLGTGPGGLPDELGPVDFELGVVAGNRSLNPLFSRVISGADDGKVAVEETKVEGMTDFIVVPHTHTYIMMRDNVIEQVAFFLEHGRFRRATMAVEDGVADTSGLTDTTATLDSR